MAIVPLYPKNQNSIKSFIKRTAPKIEKKVNDTCKNLKKGTLYEGDDALSISSKLSVSAPASRLEKFKRDMVNLFYILTHTNY